MPLPKIGDKHTMMCYLYQDIKANSLVLHQYKWLTPGPEYAYLGEAEVTIPILADGTAEVVAALEQAKQAALAQYQERVAAINEQLARYTALEAPEA